MIIKDDSILRRLPVALNRTQMLCFDGIRYSIDMTDIASSRLGNTLHNLAISSHKSSKFQLMPSDVALAYSDAWSVIDSVYRLQGLLERTPNVKHKSTGLRIFLKKTEQVEQLRHFIQHLDKQMNELLDLKLPALGALSWFDRLDEDYTHGYLGLIISGTVLAATGNRHYFVNPLGKKIYSQTDLITLTAGNHSICISDIMRAVEDLVSSLDTSLKAQFADSPRAGSDMLLMAEMVFNNTKVNNEKQSD